MTLIDSLEWRYATKRMTGKKVSEENLNTILDATRLSASSFGLQPYTILVVNNQDVKLKLQAAAYGQAQLAESSQVLVFCVPKSVKAEDVNTYMQLVADTRGVSVDVLKAFKDAVQGTVDRMGEEQQQVWAAKQAYIALGTALAAAASLGVDACPMEGFNKDEFDTILGLKEKGLMSMVIMAVGFRSPEDQMAGAVKVRKEKEKLFQFVN